MKKFIPVIGLEIHIELKTKSKMFCCCAADHFAKKPNTQTCPVCLGLPGALPYVNEKAVDFVLMMGCALNCRISRFSKFDRKHYFYPDLPKAFQTSQYDLPLCGKGFWAADNGSRIGITRIHLEEDTAKLVHEKINNKPTSLIDFNRSGVPLMEMVTEPEFHDSASVEIFLKDIQLIVKHLGISDAEMQKGSMRLEANVSLAEHKNGDFDIPNYKIELKNINSFKFLIDAIEYEIIRQENLLNQGKSIQQETRGYNEKTQATFSQRSKEEAKDYKYFPEPDIPPLIIEEKRIEKIKKSLPELPRDAKKRLKEKYMLSESFSDYLIQDKKRLKYFDDCELLSRKKNISVKMIADMIVNKNAMKDHPEPQLLLKKLTGMMKKDFVDIPQTQTAVDKILLENQKAVGDYINGKTQVLGFLIGMVQKELKGKADIDVVSKLLQSKMQK